MAEETFEEQFPSLKGKNGVFVSDMEFMITSDNIFSTLDGLSLTYDVCIPSRVIKEHCLDKQRVREAIEKLKYFTEEAGLRLDKNWEAVKVEELKSELGLE